MGAKDFNQLVIVDLFRTPFRARRVAAGRRRLAWPRRAIGLRSLANRTINLVVRDLFSVATGHGQMPGHVAELPDVAWPVVLNQASDLLDTQPQRFAWPSTGECVRVQLGELFAEKMKK